MALDPWYKVVELRAEVREGRSFNPDKFAIALEQVVALEYARPGRTISIPIGMPDRRQVCGGLSLPVPVPTAQVPAVPEAEG